MENPPRFLPSLVLLLTLTLTTLIQAKDVTELPRDYFGFEIDASPFVLIAFYNETDPSLPTLTSAIQEASVELEKTCPGVIIFKKSVKAGAKFIDQYKLTDLPSLKFFRGMDDPVTYQGELKAKEIVEWSTERVANTIREIGTLEDASKIIKEGAKNTAIYYGPKSGELYLAYIGAVSLFDVKMSADIFFASTDVEEIKKEYEIPIDEPTIVVHRDLDTERCVYSGEADIKELKKFLFTRKFPVTMMFEAALIRMQKNQERIAVYGRKKGEEGSESEQAFIKAANEYRGEFIFVIMDLDKESGNKLDYFHFYWNKLPQVCAMEKLDVSLKYLHRGDLSFRDLRIFFKNYFTSNLRAHYKSARIPNVTHVDGVRVAVGKNYKAIVEEPGKNVLMEWYSPYCGHCTKFAPDYAAAAKKLEGVKDLVIAKIDGVKNDVEGVELTNFPMLIFYPKENKTAPLRFDRMLTTKGVLEYVKDHVPGISITEGGNVVVNVDDSKAAEDSTVPVAENKVDEPVNVSAVKDDAAKAGESKSNEAVNLAVDEKTGASTLKDKESLDPSAIKENSATNGNESESADSANLRVATGKGSAINSGNSTLVENTKTA